MLIPHNDPPSLLHGRLRLVAGTMLAVAFLFSAPARSGELWAYDATDEAPSAVSIDFVRGDIEIIRQPGPLRIEVHKESEAGREAEVAIVASKADGRLELVDRYPSYMFSSEPECLPPVGARGDFWNSDVYLMVKVYAPDNIEIEARFMARPNRSEKANKD